MQKLSSFIAILWLAIMTLACNNDSETPKDFDKTIQFMVNGVADTAVDHNAVVALYLKDATGSCKDADGVFCTGTLIHPQYVLTAAHCVAETKKGFGNPKEAICNPFLKIGIGKDNIEAALNLYDIQDIYFPKSYKDVKIDKNYETTTHDIALIKLKESIPTSIAKPILSLPPWLGLSSANLGENGRDMEFSGFGYDDKGNFGQKLKFTGKATRYCGASNPNDADNGCRVGKITLSGCHPNPDICRDDGYINDTGYVHMPYGSFYYSQKNGGPCQGDSGGPGFVTIGGLEYVASVTSYGDGICAVYGVSGASQDFYEWILSVAPEIANTYVEICDNRVDDDGNAKTDCDDPACATAANCQTTVTEICDNGIDDDKNEKTDCDDPACATAPNCQATVTEICDNGIDDDDNGKIDCQDAACANEAKCLSNAVEICGNGIDDDNDGFTDCDDVLCASSMHCAESFGEICDNGIADTTDGLADCANPSCANAAKCIGGTIEICDNGIDDDKDGFADCKDSACRYSYDCDDIGMCSATPQKPASNPLNALILSMMAMFALFAVRFTRAGKPQS